MEVAFLMAWPSASSGVVAMISGPRDGVVAESFCRFSPYPVEGAGLFFDFCFHLDRLSASPDVSDAYGCDTIKEIECSCRCYLRLSFRRLHITTHRGSGREAVQSCEPFGCSRVAT